MSLDEHKFTIERSLRLAQSGAISQLDARLLLMHCLNCTLEDLIANGDRLLTEHERAAFGKLLARRSVGEPISQIVQHKEFWGLPFKVTRDVLTPRPDTETLVEHAIELCRERAPTRILDIGTGTGCILAALLTEFPEATGVGIDNSAAALAVAAENLRNLEFGARAVLELKDYSRDINGRFDLIVSNPPYISEAARDDLSVDVREYEPTEALFAGDGYDAYRIIIPKLPHLLNENGVAVFEVGHDQAAEVMQLLTQTFEPLKKTFDISVKNDLAGIARAIGVQY